MTWMLFVSSTETASGRSDPSHVATRSAPVTRAVFPSRTLLMISSHSNHTAVINYDLLSVLSWTAIPFEAHALAAAWPSVTPDWYSWSEMKKHSLFSPTDFTSHRISSIPCVISPLWYRLRLPKYSTHTWVAPIKYFGTDLLIILGCFFTRNWGHQIYLLYLISQLYSIVFRVRVSSGQRLT